MVSDSKYRLAPFNKGGVTILAFHRYERDSEKHHEAPPLKKVD